VAEIETDYLVIGAGASGMAFTDALIADDDVDVVMVDRRHSPGGHWNDAYPFVRLHQPSATYGVNSRQLGSETIDASGPNAGFYERATGVEICDYFRRVLEEQLVGSGQVRFFGQCDYVGQHSGEHVVSSRLTGETTTVRVRQKVVDATYLETSVPATHTPAFTIGDGVKLIPVGELVHVTEPPSGFTVLGAGKTAMDACSFLLDNQVDPEKIRWVRPRDAWLMNRSSWQPLDLVASTVESLSHVLECLAEAENVDDLFRRLEACSQLLRLDPAVEPTMFRGAIVSPAEHQSLEQIERVIRNGRVRRIDTDRIVLDEGEVPTDRGAIHVDCTAYGLREVAPRPIFEEGRITPQSLMGGFTTFNAAIVGFVEAARDDDADKNRLCPPTPYPSTSVDWISVFEEGFRVITQMLQEPDLAAWLGTCRLNTTRGMSDHMGEPRMQAAFGRWSDHMEPALANAERLRAAAVSGPRPNLQ
jgi:NAD(P)-binding Rossmann-like domain